MDTQFTNLDPLQPRDALFGGRTNSTKLYHEIDESTQDELKYIDVCSLYPFICKYGHFPLGHPTILSQENIDKDNMGQYQGLIKCKVLPPTNLYHPLFLTNVTINSCFHYAGLVQKNVIHQVNVAMTILKIELLWERGPLSSYRLR